MIYHQINDVKIRFRLSEGDVLIQVITPEVIIISYQLYYMALNTDN